MDDRQKQSESHFPKMEWRTENEQTNAHLTRCGSCFWRWRNYIQSICMYTRYHSGFKTSHTFLAGYLMFGCAGVCVFYPCWGVLSKYVPGVQYLTAYVCPSIPIAGWHHAIMRRRKNLFNRSTPAFCRPLKSISGLTSHQRAAENFVKMLCLRRWRHLQMK